MRILFLDFDGVLNSIQQAHMQHREWKRDPTKTRPYGEDFCKICCSNLLSLLELLPDLKIVVSSSWRIGHDVKSLKRILGANGIPEEFVIDKTGARLDAQRGLEIRDWLAEHPEVTEFVAVDDDSYDMGAVKERFVHTSSATGLDWLKANEVLKLFGVTRR